MRQLGCSAEIIPVEPDAGNAAAGSQMEKTLNITVNDQPQAVPAIVSLRGLVQLLKLPDSGIAVAVNGAVVSKDRWDEEQLKDRDSVLIITATQGG